MLPVGLRSLLTGKPDMIVVGEATDEQEALCAIFSPLVTSAVPPKPLGLCDLTLTLSTFADSMIE